MPNVKPARRSGQPHRRAAVDAVCDALLTFPDLSRSGFGVDREDAFTMLSPDFRLAIVKARWWLAAQSRTERVSKDWDSYELKHCVERALTAAGCAHTYLPQGALIVAAHAMSFRSRRKPATRRGPDINIWVGVPRILAPAPPLTREVIDACEGLRP